MRFAPAVSAAAVIVLAGAFLSVLIAPPSTATASACAAPATPTVAVTPLLAAPEPQPRPRGPGEAPPPGMRAGPSGETVVVLEGDPPPPPNHSRATLWLALAVPLGVAMRIVVALIEGREGMLVLLACASLFLSGLVVVGG